MTTRISEHDDLLAAEYVIGVLEKVERDSFARRLAAEPALVEAVRHWEEHFALVTDDIAPVVPPQAVQSKLQARLFAANATAGTSLWSSLAFWRGLTMASLIAVVAMGGWALWPREQQQALVAEVAGETNQVKLVAYYDQGAGELRLNRVAGAAASGRSFELWLVAGQDKPVSLGVLPDNATGRVKIPENLRGKFADAVLAISDEPSGGSPTGVATGPVIAVGKLTAL